MRLPKPKQLPSGQWYMQVMIDGKRTNKTFDTDQEALYWAAGIKTQAIEIAEQEKDVTLKYAMSKYIADRSNILSPSTIKSYTNFSDNYFEDLRNKKVKKITQADIQREINTLSADKAYKTVKNAIAFLVAVVSQDHPINIKRLTFPAKEEKEHAFLEAPDIAKLIDVIKDDKIEIPILLALWLGLRRSEICALEWSDFDFEKKTVSITKALVPNKDNKYVIKNTTKTAKSKRTLSVPEYVISRLEAAQSDPSKRVGRITKMNPNDIYNHLKVICDNNGIPFVGIHGLRHTNASVMLSIGVTAKLAMARGGWSSNKTMQDIYQHLFSEDKKAADTMIDDYFNKLISD